MFSTFDAKYIFSKLRQAFDKALILNHFDLKYYIRIETDIFHGYLITKILSQLILDDLD